MTSIISIKNVKKYFKDVKALDDVSFDIEEGKVLGLLGPNGAGKTTLVRVLATLLTPDSGSVAVLGKDLASNQQFVRENIGLAGQFAAIDEQLSGTENLVMFGRLYHLSRTESKKQAKKVLSDMGLLDAADKPVKNYSGGMRRRLDLGASLMFQPKILFLDEPTTGLDPRTRNDLWKIIQSFVASGTTVVLTTQYLEEADALADKIVLIDQGKIVAEGTSAQLKKKLGGAMIEMSPVDWADAAALKKITNTALKTRKTVIDEAKLHLRVPAKNNVTDLDALLTVIKKSNIKLDHIGMIQPSLDEVFLNLTGKGSDV